MGYLYSRTFFIDYTFQFTTYAFFNRSRSWLRPNPTATIGGLNYLLRHEQLHFDIAEIFAHKLLQEFNKHHYTYRFSAEIDQVYANVNKQKIEMENKYDLETRHGVDANKQAYWDEYITGMLKQLN